MTVVSEHVGHSSIIKKMGVTELIFLVKLEVFLTVYIVTVVTCHLLKS